MPDTHYRSNKHMISEYTVFQVLTYGLHTLEMCAHSAGAKTFLHRWCTCLSQHDLRCQDFSGPTSTSLLLILFQPIQIGAISLTHKAAKERTEWRCNPVNVKMGHNIQPKRCLDKERTGCERSPFQQLVQRTQALCVLEHLSNMPSRNVRRTARAPPPCASH